MRISDWSSDVCSSDLERKQRSATARRGRQAARRICAAAEGPDPHSASLPRRLCAESRLRARLADRLRPQGRDRQFDSLLRLRSEEHTSELQSLMRISYAVFCLKKKIK